MFSFLNSLKIVQKYIPKKGIDVNIDRSLQLLGQFIAHVLIVLY